MKKILSLVLAALMIFSVLPAAFAAEEAKSIEETSEYAEAIKFLNTLKVYKGKENGDLAAEQGVQRWEAALFLYRAATGDVAEADIKTTTNYTSFKDIDIGDFDGSSAATLGAIAWAAQAKVTNGTAADKFDPTAGILYQDAITMIVRLLGSRYTSASYPYGFVTTARELGITAGISGVGLEDEINRGVFAQLLYNAIFAEVEVADDKVQTLASKVFDVEKDIVLLTASKNVFYETTGAVCKAGYVGFKTIDGQGEPVGHQYHATVKSFGIANDTAANAAVGNAYAIYHTGNFETIISARSLSEVYWNLGDADLDVKASFTSNGNTSYVTVGGSKYTVVATYSDLRNNQLAGTDEVKLYKTTGGAITSGSSNYFKDDTTGHIWCFDSENGLTLYATYIPALKQYYREVNGQYVIGTYDDIITNAGTLKSAKGFSKLTGESAKTTNGVNYPLYHSAYAKYTVTDANDDGYADRVTMKQYSFGYFDKDKKTKDGAAEDVFTIKYADGIDNVIDTWATNDPSGKAADAGAQYARKADYRWTGLDWASVKDGCYVLYYIDNTNKEIDVLEVISGAKASADDATYVVSGYVRNMDVTTNKIVLDDGNVYTIGYDTLNASPLKSKNYRALYTDSNYQSNNYNLANNVSVLHPMLNTYKTLYIVDNKVVYIAGASANNDFVILDSFVAFDEDAIVAKAYTTVSDEYTEIKISGYNGWNVGGFDYYLYFLSNLIGKQDYALPFTLNKVYQVASIDANGYYNLTDAAPLKNGSNVTIAVNEYGYITGTDGANNFGKDRYKALDANDYWLILDLDVDNNAATKDDAKVYAYSGKLNPITMNGVDVYKTKQNDYVLVASDATNLDSMTGIFGGDVKFMLYNADIAQYYNEGWLNQTSGYNYQIWMTNVLTGGMELVTIDNKLVTNNWNGYYKSVALTDHMIYKVVGDTLYADSLSGAAVAVDFEDVAAYYGKTAGYVASGSFQMAGVADNTSNTAANALNGVVYEAHVAFEKAVADKVADKLYGNWEEADIAKNDRFLTELAKKVTLFGKYDKIVDASMTYLTQSASVLNDSSIWNLKDTSKVYTVYYVIAADGSAIAWVEKPTTSVNTSYTGTVTADAFTFKPGVTATATYNALTDKTTVVVDMAADPINAPAGTNVTGATVVTSAEKITQATITIAGQANAASFVVVRGGQTVNVSITW